MKTVVKAILSMVLCVALCISVLPAIAVETEEAVTGLSAAPFSAWGEMTAVTDGETLKVNTKVVNTGVTEGTVIAYKVTYDKSNEPKKYVTEKIDLEVGETENRTFSEAVNSANGEYMKIYLWEKGSHEPLCAPVSSDECRVVSFDSEEIEINTSNVFASSEPESGNNATKAADGKMDTYWSAKKVTLNSPQSVTAVLDNVYELSEVAIAFGKGSERSYEFSVEASLDGTYYETVVDRQFSENTDDLQYYETYIAQAKYVRFTVYGKDVEDTDNWIQVSEIAAFGSLAITEEGEAHELLAGDWSVRAMTEYNQQYTPTMGAMLYGEKNENELHIYDSVDRDGRITNMVDVKKITASQTPEEGNAASNVFDLSTSTKWTAEAVCETNTAELLMEFEEGTCIDTLNMAFGVGERGYIFAAAISPDGTNYFDVVEKTTAAKDDKLHAYTFDRTEVKYLKLTFYGREDREGEADWIQVTEAEPCDSMMEIEGAGGILMGKECEVTPDKGKYNISFDINFASALNDGTKADYYWSGITLANGFPTGGADAGKFAALQLRFENSDGKIKIRKLTSNRFNEGSLKDFMYTTFNMDTDVHFSFDVDPSARKIDISVSDGESTANRMLYYNYENDERTHASTWTGHEAKWLIFNSGAGAKSEYFVKNIVVTEKPETKSEISETVIANPYISDESVEFRLLADSQGDYVASLGDKLYGEVVSAPKESGINGNAIHIYDAVGRATDEQNGAGGVAAYIDLPYPETNTPYKVEFTMYAPVADDYGGFSLGRGRNSTVGSSDNPFAMQTRFMTEDEKFKFKTYSEAALNKGTLSDLVGKYTTIEKNVPWHISIVVDPRSVTMNLSLDDGKNYQTDKIKDYCGYAKDWLNGEKIDTLMINTGIGGNGDIYVGDIKVTELGDHIYNSSKALNGVVRLMASSGTGKYMHHNGDVTVDFLEKQTINYTRFVERGGLIGEDTVSFEVMNRPGYFLTIIPGTDNVVQVKPYEDNASFKANATFRKEAIANSSKIRYSSFRDPYKYLYDNDKAATAVVWSLYDRNRVAFTVKGEASPVVADDFKSGFKWDEWIPGYTFNQEWRNGVMYSYHNHTGVARSSNIVYEADPNNSNDAVCYLSTTKDSGAHVGNKWGQDYANDYNFGKSWEGFKGYVGVMTVRREAESGQTDPYKFNKNSFFEGSFRQPLGDVGYWTAFWLNGRDSWPPEIDIFEYLSSWGGGKFFSNIHRSTSSSSGYYYTLSDGSLRTKFHTYALDWGDGFIDWYFDGEHYKRVEGDMATFQKNCELIINSGLGGWETEPNEKTRWDTGLRIDWIRAYQW